MCIKKIFFGSGKTSSSSCEQQGGAVFLAVCMGVPRVFWGVNKMGVARGGREKHGVRGGFFDFADRNSQVVHNLFASRAGQRSWAMMACVVVVSRTSALSLVTDLVLEWIVRSEMVRGEPAGRRAEPW